MMYKIAEFSYETSTKIPDSESCVALTMEQLQVPADAMYIRKHFDKTVMNPVLEIVDGLKHELKKMFKQSTWMDNATKAVVLEKLENLKVNAGFAKELLDDEKLIELNKDIKIDDKNFLQTLLDTNLFKFRVIFGHLKSPIADRWVRLRPAFSVIPTYQFSENAIRKISSLKC